MNIRDAISSDIESIKNLWKYCYNDFDNYLNWYFNRVYPSTNNLVVEDDGNKIVSALQISPCELFLHGDSVASGYLRRLCTMPQNRRAGSAKSLIRASISHMREHGQVISFIVPSDYKTVEKYGYRLVYQYKEYKLKMCDIPSYKQNANVEFANIDNKTIKNISEIYSEFISDKNGYVVRNNYMWSLILEDFVNNYGGKTAIVYDKENQPIGYILYILRNGTFYVYEMAYKNRMAYENIYAFIKAHSTQVQEALIKVPVEDLGYLDFYDDNRVGTALYPFAAARICDVQKALTIVARNYLGSVNIHVIDRFYEDNSGVYHVANGKVEKTDEAADVITDIGTLTQLFMGFLSVKEAVKLDLVAQNSTMLEALFQKRENYVNMLL